MAPIPTPLTSQHTAQQPLRRATYVHVSDLISAYNIDHAQLEKEIARVNTKRTNPRTSSTDVPPPAAAATHGGDDRIGTDQLFASDRGNCNRSDSIVSEFSSDGFSAPGEDADIETTHGPVVPRKRLQAPRGGFNLCVLVGKINLVVDKRRVDQSRVRLAEVEIGDETGTVSLRARDEQIELLERVRSEGKPGAVVLRNCTLELYRGKHIRLTVTKWGKLTEYPDNVSSTPPPPSTTNHDRNFSLIDLSVVASEIAEKSHSGSMPYAIAAAATSGSRQTKKPELERRTSGSPSSSPKTPSTPSKQGKSGTKHQQQTSRRSTRSSVSEQRRQARSTQYGGMKMDTSQPPRSDQMMYRTMQGYHGYGEQRTDMRMRQQYPHHAQYTQHAHAHSQSQRHQDAASAQFALHQQYEMQQRQLHQMYSREQNQQVGQVQHQLLPQQQQQSSPMLVGIESSFDTSDVGNSPVLVTHPEHYSQLPKIEGHSRMQHNAPHGAAPHGAATYPSLGAMSGYRIGKMNPEATSYAPTYLSAAQGSSSQQHMPYPPQFSPYNLSQQQQQQQQQQQSFIGSQQQQQQQQQQQPFIGGSIYSLPQPGHHPSLLVPSGVGAAHHHAMPQATNFDAALEQQHDTGTGATSATTSHSHHHRYQYPPTNIASTKDSKSYTGKENVTFEP